MTRTTVEDNIQAKIEKLRAQLPEELQKPIVAFSSPRNDKLPGWVRRVPLWNDAPADQDNYFYFLVTRQCGECGDRYSDHYSETMPETVHCSCGGTYRILKAE